MSASYLVSFDGAKSKQSFVDVFWKKHSPAETLCMSLHVANMSSWTMFPKFSLNLYEANRASRACLKT